jgi:cytochrome c556
MRYIAKALPFFGSHYRSQHMKKITVIAMAVSVTLLSAPALAQFAKPEQAIKYRKSVMTIMNTHMSRLGAMANGRIPFDAKIAADNASLVETMSKLPWAAFGEDTDLGDTNAKPEIWKEKAKFKQSSEAMMAEVSKLSAAAKTGNLDSLKAAFGPAAKSCKTCHDAFAKE